MYYNSLGKYVFHAKKFGALVNCAFAYIIRVVICISDGWWSWVPPQCPLALHRYKFHSDSALKITDKRSFRTWRQNGFFYQNCITKSRTGYVRTKLTCRQKRRPHKNVYINTINMRKYSHPFKKKKRIATCWTLLTYLHSHKPSKQWHLSIHHTKSKYIYE